MAELTYQTQNLTAFNCVLTYMKLFKYLQFSPRLSQLTHTLTEASEDLAGFLFMFLLVFMAYAFSFHMAFGMDVGEFQDFTNSFFTLFLIILGDFDFDELRLANDLLGPALFISYIVIVYLILFNMFLAIIGEAYVRVKERTSAFEDPFMRNLRAGLNARKQRRLRKLESTIGGMEEEIVTAADILEIEHELREILGDAEVGARSRCSRARFRASDGVLSARSLLSCLLHCLLAFLCSPLAASRSPRARARRPCAALVAALCEHRVLAPRMPPALLHVPPRRSAERQHMGCSSQAERMRRLNCRASRVARSPLVRCVPSRPGPCLCPCACLPTT
jgi:hypothetical protein